MNLAGIEASSLDAQSLVLVRMAALVAIDAPPVSYMLNLRMVQEWTAHATHSTGVPLTWDGIDIFPFEDGKILRKDVYSNASRLVPQQLAATG